VPIADDITPGYDSKGFWAQLFPDAPFPIITDYESLPNYIEEALDNWPANANRVWAWWIAKKRSMAIDVSADIQLLRGEPPPIGGLRNTLTVIISTSVIPIHPDTAIIQDTVKSIRDHLPHCEIIVTCDGVRAEQEARRQEYEQYLHRLMWLVNNEWHNTLPLIFDEHTHQVGMTREALKYVRTPLLLYVEADTPLVADKPIDWQAVCEAVLSGEVNHLRFSHEASILDVHQYLMLDCEPIEVCGVPLIRTIKYSQRPHVASVDFYRHVLNTHFSENAKCYIEDRLYGAVQHDYNTNGIAGWNQWRLAVYTPPGDIKRSLHSDGRAGDSKFHDRQVF
jgi:hypothetical protein